MLDQVVFTDTFDGLTREDLQGFFVGWPDPPDPAVHLALLQGSGAALVAREGADGPVVGFINALTDGALCAFIPLLEVRPDWQGRGLGRALVDRMLERLADYYSVDLCCDPGLVPFYEALGFQRTVGMSLRRYAHQAGRPEVRAAPGRSETR